jgi:hypothetical protein
MKRIFAAALCAVMILLTLTSCGGRAPEFSEIQGRLEELIEASYGVNDILFGKGLSVYPKVYENEFRPYRVGDKLYYYYVLTDAELGEIYVYKSTYQQVKTYLQKTDKEDPEKQAVYEADGYFYYEIAYEEPTYDFYYRKDTDPAGYSYVKLDDEYGSVELIKMYAETVYSEGYLKGVYEMLFTGAAVSDDASGVRGARYYNYEDPEGRVWLMSADDYTHLFKEKRVYDMSTAKIVRPSNKDFVNIEIESYLESTPDVRVKVTLSMIKQDGVWMLDSATY